jgi:hypothetical protein
MFEVSPSYILVGVGVALSVLGFFLKKLKNEVEATKLRIRECEINLVRQQERYRNIEKVVEDRRKDVQDLYKRTTPPFHKP